MKKIIYIVFLFFFSITPIQSFQETFHAQSHPKWYPHDTAQLKSLLTQNEKIAEDSYNFHADGSKIRAIIMPHASLGASGDVAAAPCRLLSKTHFKRVIVIGLMHGIYGAKTQFVLMPTNFKKYSTPLGEIDLANTSAEELHGKDSSLFSFHESSFTKEHSLEVQLPVLQNQIENFTLLPILIGNPTIDQLRKAAQILKPYINEETLVIASSDFTHYGDSFGYAPFGFPKHLQQLIKQLDSTGISHIQDQSLEGFSQFIKQTGATICGQYPINFLLALLNADAFGKTYSHLVAYNTSGKKFNNKKHSVSYAGLIFTNEDPKTKPLKDFFSQIETEDLLSLSKAKLSNLYAKETEETVHYAPYKTQSEKLPMGSFTTLTKKHPKGQLRGCIGKIISSDFLYRTIMYTTESAALKDPRFLPVTKDELDNISIALSILSTPKPAEKDEIILGKHGVILKKDGKSAVFLPEVATDAGWNLATMLEQLSRKAGLPSNAWKQPDAKYEIFETVKVK